MGGMSPKEDRISFLTSNRGKFREAQLAVAGQGISLERVRGLGRMEIQSDRIEEVASFSSLMGYFSLGRPVVVEDAGLFVDTLEGFPGAYSSYVFKTIGVSGLLKLMEDSVHRRAHFQSVVAFCDGSGVRTFTGVVEGVIASAPKGGRGFGFDPVFMPKGSRRTYAEMSLEEKCTSSHRSKAFKSFAKWYTQDHEATTNA